MNYSEIQIAVICVLGLKNLSVRSKKLKNRGALLSRFFG